MAVLLLPLTASHSYEAMPREVVSNCNIEKSAMLNPDPLENQTEANTYLTARLSLERQQSGQLHLNVPGHFPQHIFFKIANEHE